MIGDPSGHSWRNSQRLVNAAEIIEGEPAGNAGPVVLPFLTECVS